MKTHRDGRHKRLEVLLWSIAFPGFGQILNQRYVKAILFIFIEMLINVKGNINTVITSSFLLNTSKAVQEMDNLWLMFYPCIYIFAIWDAYRDAGGDMFIYMYIPFVMAVYTGTLGVVYASSVHIAGFYIGPVFLPLTMMIAGFLMGMYIRKKVCEKI